MSYLTDQQFKSIFPFENARPIQRKAIELIIKTINEGLKRHIILNAPTGIGKSVIGIAISNYFGGSYVLTSQKILQQQYVNDFSIPELKGKSNYKCYIYPKYNCDEAPCEKHCNDSRCFKNCPYKLARSIFYKSPESITNYQMFMRMTYNPNHEERDLLILDECHNLEQLLLDFTQTEISDTMLLKHEIDLSVIKNFPKENDKDSNKLIWLFNELMPNMKDLKKQASIELECTDAEDPMYKIVKRKWTFLDNFLCKLLRLHEEYLKGNECIVMHESGKKNIKFKLLFSTTVAEKYLTKFGKNTISMSATVLSKSEYCKSLNLNPDDVLYISMPSIFPVENRRIKYQPIGSLSYKNKHESKPKMVKKIEQILNDHQNDRGIIHTVSYEFADYIIKNISSEFKKRLILPMPKTRDKDIKYFMNSNIDNLVLISPSLQEGIDLKDHLSRFTVICKVPFGFLGDRWVKRRLELSRQWYNELTIQSILQMTGRSVRTESDFATGYIIDSDFDRLFKQCRKTFPSWWRESVI